MGSSTYYKLSLGSFTNLQNAENEFIHYNKVLESDAEYQSLRDSLNFKLLISKSRKYYVLSIRSIQKKSDALKLLDVVRKYNKASYIGKYRSKNALNPNSKIQVKAKEPKKEAQAPKEAVVTEAKTLSGLKILEKRWSY